MFNMQALTALLCLTAAILPKTLAAPLKAHESGGKEHIVLISNDQELPPHVEAVMERLALHQNHPDIRRVFNNSAFRGFSASMNTHCLDKLAKMTDISLVEEATTVPRAQVNFDTRSGAPWGLQRISTASNLDGDAEALSYTYAFANTNLGENSDIYMIDTGIYTANNIFGGRAKMIWSFDGLMTDNDGHGTHTAGTAGGSVLGVASKANVWGIKALDKDGGGWSSDVVGAIDAVIKFHDIRKARANNFRGSVLSMSLAASGNVQAINSAIHAAIKAGVHSVVAAGNDGENACSSSPSSSGGNNGPAITVGAIDIDGSRASFSNFGRCVDVYAPGVGVISSWIGGPNMINSLTGTSMATPHVTGIVAYAMANDTLAQNPALMKEWIRMTALSGQNGMLVANNGVTNDGGQGFLGKATKSNDNKRPDFWDAKITRPVPTSRGNGKRAFSGLNSLMKCAGNSDDSALTAAWLCNARRWTSGLFAGVSGLRQGLH